MKIFEQEQIQSALNRLAEEELYAIVLAEVEGGIRKDGVWENALTDASFDENIAKTLYMRYRVQSLKDEILIREIERDRQNPKSLFAQGV